MEKSSGNRDALNWYGSCSSCVWCDVVNLSWRKWQGAHALPTLWMRQVVTCFEQEGFPTNS